MITIIFGAGASAGSGKCLPYNPPLGNELFDNLIKLNGAFSKLDENQKEIFRKNGFEEGMATIPNDSNIINPLQKEIACYLSKFEVNYDNTYVKLFYEVRNIINNITITTLNYDLLIEQSLIKWNRLNIDYSGGNKGVTLLKLHGSSNFLPNLGQIQISGCSMVNCGTFVEGTKINATLNHLEIVEWCQNPKNDSLSPVLAMYEKSKRVVINSESINNIQRIYTNKLKESSLVVLIGIKYVEQDCHIWNPIKDCKAKILINSRSYPSDVIKWAKQNELEIKHLEGSFNEVIEEIIKAIKEELAQ